MRLDRTVLLRAMSCAVIGVGLGIFMAASQGHRQAGAHVLLVGSVGSMVCAVIHTQWPGGGRASTLAGAQLVPHQAGAGCRRRDFP